MDRNKTIETLFNELTNLQHDIRCEALVNQALLRSVQAEDLAVQHDGRFYREYRKDVYAIDRIDDNRLHQLLQLHIARSGIYDVLPEGLFHQPMAEKNTTQTAAEMAAHSRTARKKENAARKFFQPVENSFFWQRVQLEHIEENLVAGIDNGLLTDFFFRFWNFPPELNTTAAMLLVLLLPHAHSIAGDLPLMQNCLQILLQENVIITPITPGLQKAPDGPNKLGMGELGNDMVCGHSFTEDYPCLQYTIGPLENSPATAYCQDGENDLLLQVFNNYFAPVEADIFIQVEVYPEKAPVELNETDMPVLGFSVI